LALGLHGLLLVGEGLRGAEEVLTRLSSPALPEWHRHSSERVNSSPKRDHKCISGGRIGIRIGEERRRGKGHDEEVLLTTS
jgi:hypothetical protein